MDGQHRLFGVTDQPLRRGIVQEMRQPGSAAGTHCDHVRLPVIGMGADPTCVKLVLVDLPPANLYTLRLLVRVWYRCQ